jgi:hypothetical protein
MTSVSQNLQHRMNRVAVNSELERMWKKRIVAYFEVYTKAISQNNQCPGRNLILAPLKYMLETLPLSQRPWLFRM